MSWEVFRRLDRTQRMWLDRQQLDFKSSRRPRILTLSTDERWFREEFPPFPRGQTLDEIAAGAQRDELLATIWTNSPAIHRLSSGTVTRITEGTAPQVSFAGDRLFVRRFDRMGHPFVMTDASGNELQEIGRGSDVQWLPDGRVSLIWKDSIVLLSPDKNETIRLPIPDNAESSVNNMIWSPKDDRVAFCCDVSNSGYQCLIAEFDGTTLNVRRRIPLDSRIESLAWQNSNRLLFTKHCVERRRCQLYELLPFGDQIPHLVAAQDPRLDQVSVVVSRDGNRVWTMSRDW